MHSADSLNFQDWSSRMMLLSTIDLPCVHVMSVDHSWIIIFLCGVECTILQVLPSAESTHNAPVVHLRWWAVGH